MAFLQEVSVLLFFALFGAMLTFVVTHFYFKAKTYEMGIKTGEKLFEQQKSELEKAFEAKYSAELEKWKIQCETAFRQDAVERSRAVLKGKIGEQLAPLFASFGHNPADAHFIGAPVDYVIFDNYTKVKDGNSSEPITIVLADVKTQGATLSREQWEIKKAVDAKRIKWETIKLEKKL